VLQTAVLAFSLSTDAFAASVAKGAKFQSLTIRRALCIAGGFGLLEALSPLVGYVLGLQFAGYIEDYDHWVAFLVLGALGLRMVWMSFQESEEEVVAAFPTWGAVAATALGTSVDATAVGVTLALFSDNIPLTLAAIGVVTFGMCFMGLRLGGLIGARTGKRAELIGGIGLFLIGLNILVTHLSH
jgi:putative Mn2+ efflux pump MntP